MKLGGWLAKTAGSAAPKEAERSDGRSVHGLPWSCQGRGCSALERGPAQPGAAGGLRPTRNLEQGLRNAACTTTAVLGELIQDGPGDRQLAQPQAQTKVASRGHQEQHCLGQTENEAGACQGGADMRPTRRAVPGRKRAAPARTSWQSRRSARGLPGHLVAAAHAGPSRNSQKTFLRTFWHKRLQRSLKVRLRSRTTG